MSIRSNEILVGDLIKLDIGMEIPCDGIVTKCNELSIDESSLTGEFKLLKKCTLETYKPNNWLSSSKDHSPILISGSIVNDGEG